MHRILLIALLALLAPAALAQREPARIALVITNEAYTQRDARLTNTHRDGSLIKDALEMVGFNVTLVRDTPNEGAMLAAIADHVARLSAAGSDAVGFLYYSGHGAADRPNGENYLIPTAAPITHVNQLPLLAVKLEKITESLARVGRMSFVVFDACRNVPLQRDDKNLTFKGFAPVREQSGLLVAFATEPGNVAVDQSLYARALAEEIVRPGQEAGAVFRRVRLKVREETQRQQSPEYLDKRDHDFAFKTDHAPAALPLKASTAELSMRDCVGCPELIVLPYNRGSAPGTPQRQLAISRQLVSIEDWNICERENSCRKIHARDGQLSPGRPATLLSWLDAQAYTAWLSRKTGNKYRLASSEEWEFALRATRGTENDMSNNDWIGMEWTADCWKAANFVDRLINTLAGDCTFRTVRATHRPSWANGVRSIAKLPDVAFRVARDK